MEADIPKYNLMQPFTISLEENPTTGYLWDVKMTPGLKVNQTIYSNHCAKGIQGCGGLRTWVVQGISRGIQRFYGEKRRDWEEDSIGRVEFLIEII